MVCQTTNPEDALETAYLAKHVDAIGLCGRISELLFDLPSPDGDVAITWGHVGDLTEVNSRLQAVIAFLERSSN